jgi:hypothetical protein
MQFAGAVIPYILESYRGRTALSSMMGKGALVSPTIPARPLAQGQEHPEGQLDFYFSVVAEVRDSSSPSELGLALRKR